MKKIITLIVLPLMLLLGSKAFSQVTYPCGVYFLSMDGTTDKGLWDKFYSSDDYTLAAWVQTRDAVWQGKEMSIFYRQKSGFGNPDQLDLYLSTEGEFKFRAYILKDGVPSFETVGSGLKPTPFTWYHVAVTFKKTGECTIYINGNVAASAAFGGPMSVYFPYSDVISIGSRYGSFGSLNSYYTPSFKGYIDEIAFAGKALNQEQIRTLANGLPKGNAFLTDNLVYSYDKEDTYPGRVNSGIGGGSVAITGQLNYCQYNPPVANAGPDQTITLPVNTVTLNGSVTPGTGTVTGGVWSKLSGPTGGDISDPSSQTPVISNLQEGIYIFRLTVTDNNAKTGTDDVTVTVKPATPISIIDPNPSIIKSDGTLDATLTGLDFSKIVKGAATDGITKILLVKETNDNNPITFTVLGAKNGTLSSLTDQSNKTVQPLTISPIEIPGRGKLAIVIYNAPDGYGNDQPFAALGGRDVTVSATNSDNITIRLYSPPIVMVHGMWSSPSVWTSGSYKSFAFYLHTHKNANLFTTYADYKNDNFRTFDPLDNESKAGRQAVKTAIEEGLSYYRNTLKVAATQADIVGHSLGAIMTRSFAANKPPFNYFRKDSYYKGFVHKLISLGAPHKGSPLGAFLERYKDGWAGVGGLGVIKVNVLLNGVGMKIGSCHRDFSSLEAYSHLEATPPFKTFAIVGNHLKDALSQEDGSGDKGTLNLLLKTISNGTEDFDAVFRSPCLPSNAVINNDIIVGVNSQIGGNSNNQIFYGTAHSTPADMTETNNPAIFEKVYDLLLSDKPDDFGIGFPNPITVKEDCYNGKSAKIDKKVTETPKNLNNYTYNSTDSGYINITSPVSGYSLNQGDSLKIHLEFTAVNGAKPYSGLFIIEGYNNWIPVPNVPPFSIDYALPANTPIGKLNLIALCLDSSGKRMADTSYINILPSGFLDSISVHPGSIIMDSISRETSLHIEGIYKNGNDTSVFDISHISTGTNYSSKKGATISTIDGKGIVSAVSAGRDTLMIENSGKQKSIPIYVDSNFNQATLYPNIIHFTQEDKFIGDEPFALTATSTSAQDIQYTLISGPIDLNSGMAVIKETGTVYVRASSSRNAYYDSANSVIISFRIIPTIQYVFTGTGNWNNSVNWSSSKIPPATLPKGSEIIINPPANGECVLDVKQTISSGAKFTVQAGAKLKIIGNLEIKSKHNIGELYQGGIIFYLDGNDHGLICSPEDIGIYPWDLTVFDPQNFANYNPPLVGSSGTGYGTGTTNTNQILTNIGSGNYAASKCKSYNGGGFTDWYLPSKDELNLMYNNLKVKGVTNFSSTNSSYYWSSSEIDNKNVWAQKFDDGIQSNSTWKNNNANVRAIRSF